MIEYDLKLSEEEINKILFVLSKQPYEQVFELIEKIRGQAIKQDDLNDDNMQGYFINNQDTGI